MPGTTPVYGFPYPEPTDLVADYPALGQDLAEDIETVIKNGSNFALINAGGTALTGAATITVSGITNKSRLFIWVDAASSANASSQVRLRLNADAANNYYYAEVGLSGTAVASEATNAAHWTLATMGNNAANTVTAGIEISGTNTAGIKIGSFTGVGTGTTSNAAFSGHGYYSGTATISSVSLISTSGNFDAGTIYVYGA